MISALRETFAQRFVSVVHTFFLNATQRRVHARKEKNWLMSDDETVPDATDVALVINDQGEIVECIDAKTGKPLRHEYVEQHSIPHKHMLRRHGRRERRDGATEEEERLQALKIIPFGHLGECIVYNMFDAPSASGFPFGIGEFAYCEGLLMCEIQGTDGEILDDRSLSTFKFEMTTAFRGYEPVDPPGLIQTHEEKESLVSLVSPFHHALDPILTMYDDQWKSHWAVGLSSSQNHFVGVYKSDWNGVAKETCASSGHDIGVHYYVVVRGGLPETTAEQLTWLAKTSSNDTWESKINSFAVAKATEMARFARLSLLHRALDVLHVKQRGEVVSTEWNIVRPAIYRLESNASVDTRAVFYRRCTSTTECKTGVLTMFEDQTIEWLHGPPTTTRSIGGKSWSNTESANAFPVFRDGRQLPLTHDAGWGKCVLKQVYSIR